MSEIVNAYVCPPQARLRFSADIESISLVGRELCDSLRHVVDELVSTILPTNATFENVLAVILHHENEFQLTSNLIGLYSLVAADPELRKAAAQASEKFSHSLIDCKTDANLFHLVDMVYQRHSIDNTLDVESHKALVEERRSYMRRGIGLFSADAIGTGRAVGDIARTLKSIQSEFVKNLDEKQHSIWLTRHELAGIPDDALAGLEAGTGELDGKLRLYLNALQTRWMLSLASSPATREKIYLGTRTVVMIACLCFSSILLMQRRQKRMCPYSRKLFACVTSRHSCLATRITWHTSWRSRWPKLLQL